MRDGEPDDEEIADFIDGRLDDRRRMEVERWLARHPPRAAEVARQREVDRALKGLGADILEEPIPERLRRILEQSAPEPKTPDETEPSARLAGPSLWRPAFIGLALLLVGAAGGWLARSALPPESTPVDALLADASYAYTFYARNQDYGIEFPPDGLDRFFEVSRQLYAREVAPPDLGPAGYRFRGARLAPTGRRTSTFFFFERENGDDLVVLLWRKSALSPPDPGFRVVNDIEASYWFLDGLGFAILAQNGDEKSLQDLSADIIKFYHGRG